jgi:hypothetical protein
MEEDEVGVAAPDSDLWSASWVEAEDGTTALNELDGSVPTTGLFWYVCTDVSL